MVTTCIVHWQLPSKLMTFDVPIACVTKNNRIVTFDSAGNKERWEWLIDKYRISYWAFISEITPFN